MVLCACRLGRFGEDGGMAEAVVRWRPELLPAVVDVFVEVFNAEPWSDRWSVDSATRRLRDLQATPGFEGAALVVDGVLTAFVGGYRQRWWDNSDHFYIAEMAVRPHAQRTGQGTRLLRAFLAELHDVSRVYLLTAAGGPAADFYRTLGFQSARRQHVMTRSGPA
jgi:aminoglycoside 6'-N-acetyltransferase I